MNNIFKQNYQVSKSDRESIIGNKSFLFGLQVFQVQGNLQ